MKGLDWALQMWTRQMTIDTQWKMKGWRLLYPKSEGVNGIDCMSGWGSVAMA